MLRGRVVKDHIQHDADTAFMRPGNQFVKVVQRAVGRVNGSVVRHVVTVIHLRRDIKRRQPDGVNAKGFQVVKALRYAAQIAGAAAGGILKTLWVNLIDNAVLPPVRKGIHSTFLQMRRGATAPRKRELNNLQRALTELTLVNHGSQRHWDDNRHRHRQRKYLPE